jgi:hypothetical protein
VYVYKHCITDIEKRGGIMQKWEYLHIDFENKYYAINGVKNNYKPDEGNFAIIQRLGLQGWELVLITQVGVYICKRPLD